MCKSKVPIDEEGVTKETTAVDSVKAGTGTEMDDHKNYMQGSSWRQSSLPFVWNPPIPNGGSCGNWDAGKAGLIDLCPALTKVREGWSWAIYIFGCLGVWAVGTRAIGGGSK